MTTLLAPPHKETIRVYNSAVNTCEGQYMNAYHSIKCVQNFQLLTHLLMHYYRFSTYYRLKIIINCTYSVIGNNISHALLYWFLLLVNVTLIVDTFSCYIDNIMKTMKTLWLWIANSFFARYFEANIPNGVSVEWASVDECSLLLLWNTGYFSKRVINYNPNYQKCLSQVLLSRKDLLVFARRLQFIR